MKTPSIRVVRFPYEEPYHLHLLLEASNGRLYGELEYYCNADDFEQLGNQLTNFSGKRGEEVVYERGSEKPKDRSAYFLSIRAKPVDLSGHCAVRIRMNNNQQEPDKEMIEFSIKANVADLNRLGRLFIGFRRLEHRVLQWQVQDGRLIEQYEEAV
jgi:hypothetical protein